jgi:hypothetical protein
MVVDYTLRLRTCQGADGSTDLNGTPGRVIVKPQKGDRTLRVTLTWTAASPAVQEMTVALVPLNDTVVYADAHGPSPLVLETQARPLLEAEDPDGFRVLASPGGACGTAPSVGSAQKQAAKVHIEWNAAS